MKVDLLGAKYSPSAAAMDHTVVPFVGLPAASVQVNAVPPHSWTSMPRCCLYQARSATGSVRVEEDSSDTRDSLHLSLLSAAKLERTAFATPNAWLRRASARGHCRAGACRTPSA